jgi:MFS family permease
LLIGVVAMGLSMLFFGLLNNFPSTSTGKWLFFATSVACRILMGFGNGCLNSATSSIIAFNYPESMGFLIGL